MRHRYRRGVEAWSEHTRSQPDLELGQHVLECPGYDKYTIRTDGSGNVTDRNRKYLRAFTPDHNINPPSLYRPCTEQPKRLEAAVPSPVEGTPSTEEAPVPATQDGHTPEALQTPAQEDPQGMRQTSLMDADVASTAPSPAPQVAAPQPAAGETRGAGSPLCRSTRASRPPRRYNEEF